MCANIFFSSPFWHGHCVSFLLSGGDAAISSLLVNITHKSLPSVPRFFVCCAFCRTTQHTNTHSLRELYAIVIRHTFVPGLIHCSRFAGHAFAHHPVPFANHHRVRACAGSIVRKYYATATVNRIWFTGIVAHEIDQVGFGKDTTGCKNGLIIYIIKYSSVVGRRTKPRSRWFCCIKDSHNVCQVRATARRCRPFCF